jgi:hypothetical protein
MGVELHAERGAQLQPARAGDIDEREVAKQMLAAIEPCLQRVQSAD